MGSVTQKAHGLRVGERSPRGHQKRGRKLGGEHGSSLQDGFRPFPWPPWGGNWSSVFPPMCRVSRPCTQRCHSTLPLGPKVSPWAGPSGKVLAEGEARGRQPHQDSGCGAERDRPTSKVAARPSQQARAWEGPWDQNRNWAKAAASPTGPSRRGLSEVPGTGAAGLHLKAGAEPEVSGWTRAEGAGNVSECVSERWRECCGQCEGTRVHTCCDRSRDQGRRRFSCGV